MHLLFLGIVVSLFVSEATGYSPGGIVVVGYLAFFFAYPLWLAGTLAAALLTLALVRLLERRLLLYGRRLFAVYILAGMLIGQGAILVMRGGVLFDWGLLVIGYLVPGLIARDFARQGVVPTLLVLALAVAATRLAALAGEGWLW
jgi:poly-gamma-glutamate biosynthesis protein PgsC/CapC